MSGSMQTMITEKITNIVIDSGLKPATSYTYSNVGHIYGVDKDTLESKVDVRYDFQTSYAIFSVNGEKRGLYANYFPKNEAERGVPEVLGLLKSIVGDALEEG